MPLTFPICQACGCETAVCVKCDICGADLVCVRELNTLTADVTAFRSFAEFAQSMRAGYVPSIYSARGKKYARLATLVRRAGFRVYDGKKVA